MKNIAVLALALSLPALAIESWGLEELETSQKEAIVAFEKTGASVRDITGYSLKLTSQANAARAEIYFTGEFGQKETAKFFCHLHGDHIDCH